MPETIKTIDKNYTSEFKEKGSRFLGFVFPAKSEEEAETILQNLRKEHYNATHHCYAYTIFEGPEKYSDDGEPNGTAGIRIKNAIDHFGLTNLLVVSVRYYGGTKLGVGPLGKAYYRSALETLKAAKIVTLRNYSEVRIDYEYDLTSIVHHLAAKYETRIADNIFDKTPAMIVYITAEKTEEFRNEIKESSNAKIKTTVVKSDLYIREK